MKRQRRTPVQERAQATVEALLEATAHLLVQEGFARMSTNRIAQRAGVSIGSLYQYFSDKEALVAALNQRVAEAQMAAITAQLGRIHDEPLDEAVRSLIRGIIEAKRVEPQLAQALAQQAPRVGGHGAQQDLLRRLGDVVSATLRRRRDIRDVDVELSSFALVNAMFAVTQAAVITRPELIADDQLAEILAQMCIRYLAPEPVGRG